MKISVVMPVARVDDFLLLTLDSVSQQTFDDFELIVVCSSDIYTDISKIFDTKKFPFPCKIIHTNLRGVAFAANLGISHAQGEFIARWDSDDLCDSNRLGCQLEEFERDESLGVVGSRVVIIDEVGRPNQFQNYKFYPDNKSIRRVLKYRQPLLHSSLMFRSKILFDNKGYLYGHTSEDHELFIRIARNKNIVFKNISDVVTYYRRHSSQLSDVSNQYIHFYEISGFMFTEFLRTWNILYVLGMIVNIPALRRVRYHYRAISKYFSKEDVI